MWTKNDSGSSKNHLGQTIADQAYYEIGSEEVLAWANASEFLTDIATGDFLMAKDDSGNTEILDVNDAINYLKGNIASKVEAHIQEEIVLTGGHYQACGVKMAITAAIGWNTKDVVFPFPIGLLAAEWNNSSDFSGDKIEMQVAPSTTVGTLTQNVAASATEIDVSQSVIDNIQKGYGVEITDGTNTDALGRVVSIDSDTLKITVETATINAFLAATPTYIKQTVYLIAESYLDTNGRQQLGESKIGASHIPADTILRARFYNSTTTAKTFIFFIEYLY